MEGRGRGGKGRDGDGGQEGTDGLGWRRDGEGRMDGGSIHRVALIKGHGAVFILVAQARALATCFRSPLAPNPNPERLFPAMGSPGGGGLEAATPKAPRHQATAKIAKEPLAQARER